MWTMSLMEEAEGLSEAADGCVIVIDVWKDLKLLLLLDADGVSGK